MKITHSFEQDILDACSKGLSVSECSHGVNEAYRCILYTERPTWCLCVQCVVSHTCLSMGPCNHERNVFNLNAPTSAKITRPVLSNRTYINVADSSAS